VLVVVQVEIQRFDSDTRESMNSITERYTLIDSLARELMASEEEEARNAFAR
jgi:hypothetical protein